MRLRDIFGIGREKTPGFGITKSFYLSVLASKMPLPAITEVMNPRGEGGAIAGFAAPLRSGATKDELTQPFQRGLYALATPDRKTVLRLAVVSKEEAGFRPDPILASSLAQDLSPETLNRILATWTLLQVSFESHDPAVHPSLNFLLRLARQMASLTEGVVADPISRRYRLPEEVLSEESSPERVFVSDVVTVHHRMTEHGLTAFTLGMIKFDLPEIEIQGLEAEDLPSTQLFLYGVSQSILTGKLLEVGGLLGHSSAPLRVVNGGLDRAHWEGIPCLELIPEGKAKTVSQCLKVWREQS
ncbi:MAG: hypothetical protein MUC92_07175 [Fimbriimonadaceae bacterium]|jgi:hypothetical protein|nr:hypothetical protein [Fimbriimonadaceae bacterium]